MKQTAQLYALGAILFLGGLVGLVFASAAAAEDPDLDSGLILILGWSPVVAGIAVLMGATYRLFKNVDKALTRIDSLFPTDLDSRD